MNIDTNKRTTTIVTIFFVVLLVLFSLIPIFRCFIPIAVGSLLIFIGDKLLKRIWNLSDDKWSKPASMGWTIFTCLSMCVMSFITLLVQIGELSSVTLIVIICIYFLLSIVILNCKRKKIYKINQSMNSFGFFSDDYDELESDDMTPLRWRVGGLLLMVFGAILNVFWLGVVMAIYTGTGREAISVFLLICFCGVSLFLLGLFMYNGKLYKLHKNTPQKSIHDILSDNHSLDIEQTDDPQDFDTDDIAMIDCMDGHSFEYFCAEVLEKNGFKNVSVTKGSGDQGVDVLTEKGGIKYAIQCKNYSSALGNTPVQEVYAGKIFYNCHVGVVMTNSTFTQGAKELAQATGVLLWDRKVLQEMMDS